LNLFLCGRGIKDFGPQAIYSHRLESLVVAPIHKICINLSHN
jgi:hypothetical protein